FAGRPVGAVDGEAPAQPVGFGADFVAVARDTLFVIAAPGFRAARGNGAVASRLHEFDAAGIGKGFLRRIDDLDDVAAGAAGGKLADGAIDLGNGTPEIGQDYDLRQRRGREGGRQARAV